MAKKVVASLQKQEQKVSLKLIKMVSLKKTGSYHFKQEIIRNIIEPTSLRS